jgi:GT2 family glycosyltransferase
MGSLCHRLNVTLLKKAHSGPAAARSYGAGHAQGLYLAFTDDDCMPAPDWLGRLAQCFSMYPEAVLGGCTVNALVDNPYSAASQLLVDYLNARWNPSARQATFFTSNNLALPAKSFNAGGGLEVFVPDAVVQHAHCLSFPAFCRQHFNYGRGAHRLHQLRAERTAARIRFESLASYLTAIAYPCTQAPLRKAPDSRCWLHWLRRRMQPRG